MPELGTLGSVRGALSNERPYRDLAHLDQRRPFEASKEFLAISMNQGIRDFRLSLAN